MDNDDRATLLLPIDYVNRAAELVKQAKKRVYIVSLSLTRSPVTNKLIDAILDAARRGVDVHVAVDLMTFVCDRQDMLPSRLAGRGMVQTNRLRREFVDAGAKFCWLGARRVPYFLGRTHSKWTVIDNHVFAFGGVNLNYSGTAKRTDYILHVEDRHIADRLVKEQLLIENLDPEHIRVSDHAIKTKYGTMLMDSGQFRKSIIYTHANKLAREAVELLVVSQYCPSGRLGKVIRSKNSRVYFNPKGSADDAVNNFLIGNKVTASSQPNLYTRSRYLHAKFIVATLPDGTKKAITGSHNFTAMGVRAGTREIALETTDPHIISQLENFWANHVK